MTVNNLIKDLRLIIKAHPEAKDAEIWAQIRGNTEGHSTNFHLRFIGFDKHHKPARLTLED